MCDIYFLSIVALCFFPNFSLGKSLSGCFRKGFFHLGDKKKLSLVALNRWPSYTVTIIWEIAWADSLLVVLDEWWSYVGGRLNRFDCNYVSWFFNLCLWTNIILYLNVTLIFKCPSHQEYTNISVKNSAKNVLFST